MALDGDDWTQNIPPYGDEQPGPRLSVVSGAGPSAGADDLPEPVPTFDFPRVSISDIYSAPSPEPAFVWAGRIPMGHVTLLGAHGGVGKSMLALQLAVAVCLGADFLGASTEQGRVLFFSGEDGAAVLRHRLGHIATHFGASPRRLAKSLTILDATDEPALYREVSQFGIKTGEGTPGFSRLAEIIAEVRPSLIVVDNASDVFEASENDRASVRGFMRQLRQLFPDGSEPPAMLLLAHIQKAATGGRHAESYSGSTAWHNSARSRLALTADKDDATRLTLSHDKLNLGPRTAESLRLVRSHTGLLMLDEVERETDGEPPELALLRVLADFVERGEKVSAEPNSPRTNTWALLRPEPSFPKHAYRVAGALFSAMRELERRGLIQKELYRNLSRKDRIAWTLAPKGWELIGKSAPSAPSAPTPEVGTLDAVGAEAGAPSAPTSCARGVGVERAHGVGATLPVSSLAEKPTCPRCDGEGCSFCQEVEA